MRFPPYRWGSGLSVGTTSYQPPQSKKSWLRRRSALEIPASQLEVPGDRPTRFAVPAPGVPDRCGVPGDGDRISRYRVRAAADRGRVVADRCAVWCVVAALVGLDRLRAPRRGALAAPSPAGLAVADPADSEPVGGAPPDADAAALVRGSAVVAAPVRSHQGDRDAVVS